MAQAQTSPAATGVPGAAAPRRTRLSGELAPAHAALLVAGEPGAFALTGAWAGVQAIAGAHPLLRCAPGEDPFTVLDRLPACAPGDGVVVGGGWFGALAYRLAERLEPTRPAPPRGLHLPAAPLAYHDWVIVCDADGAWWWETIAAPDREAEIAPLRARLAGRLAAGVHPRPARLRDVRFRGAGEAGQATAIAAAQERIRAGELFQANLCQHLDARLEGAAADLAVVVVTALAPAHGAFLEGDGWAVVSASPELFLRRRGRQVLSAPIKGTAPAGEGVALAASAKDRAENVMIVDLMRNDLGRVCDFGSVAVEVLATARSVAGVSHLISEVSGHLRDGVDDAALLRATFPPGSVTGAPKVQALAMIAELEGSARELYTGAIGYASPLAGLELSVTIRTLELVADRVQLGVGGGITAASVPEAELEECRVKAAPMLAAGGAGPPRPVVRPGPGYLDAIPVALVDGRRRPRAEDGLIETVLVVDGACRRLDDHLARLGGAATGLGLSVPPDLRDRITGAAVALGVGRLRIDLDGEGVRLTTGALPSASRSVALAPCLLPGGLGAAKWADRGLVDALTAALGATPLFVDGDGAVLEAGWASVWRQDGDRLLTPPADGRLLPGVTRAWLLAEDPRCAEGPSPLPALRNATQLWLSSALRGLVPAHLVG